LLAQVAGRTGRGERGGKVMIQTFAPEHPCIELAARHDYLAFSKLEMALRKQHLYPPYQRLVRLIIRSLKEDAAVKFAGQLAAKFDKAAKAPECNPPHAPGVRILGPAEAPVYRLNNYYRQHFQLQSASPGLLHKVLRDVVATAKPPHGVEFQIDVDPYNMM
jgi:primosomal protein N' (replication factor Y) (superfamily II helicase)